MNSIEQRRILQDALGVKIETAEAYLRDVKLPGDGRAAIIQFIEATIGLDKLIHAMFQGDLDRYEADLKRFAEQQAAKSEPHAGMIDGAGLDG